MDKVDYATATPESVTRSRFGEILAGLSAEDLRVLEGALADAEDALYEKAVNDPAADALYILRLGVRWQEKCLKERALVRASRGE